MVAMEDLLYFSIIRAKFCNDHHGSPESDPSSSTNIAQSSRENAWGGNPLCFPIVKACAMRPRTFENSGWAVVVVGPLQLGDALDMDSFA